MISLQQGCIVLAMFCIVICGAVYASYDWVVGRLLGCALVAHVVWASVAPTLAKLIVALCDS
jgi:hypothetical protein